MSNYSDNELVSASTKIFKKKSKTDWKNKSCRNGWRIIKIIIKVKYAKNGLVVEKQNIKTKKYECVIWHSHHYVGRKEEVNKLSADWF